MYFFGLNDESVMVIIELKKSIQPSISVPKQVMCLTN